MKTLKILVPAAALLLFAGQAVAQSQEEAELVLSLQLIPQLNDEHVDLFFSILQDRDK